MALVSPGVQITVTDQTQYVPTAVGSVPLVLLATAQDKTANGSFASGTSKANAGQLQIFTSQRELIAGLGYPFFETTAAGTAVHGSERNEYGLQAAYSALGIGNLLYAIRADIDLNELEGTSVRPRGEVESGTYWLDLADTSWGIFEWNATTQSFTQRFPILITDPADTTTASYGSAILSNVITSEATPLASIGQVGSYAVVATTVNNRVFKKNSSNVWTLVGDIGWQNSLVTVSGSAAPGTISNNVIVINTTSITISGGLTLTNIVTNINNAAIQGVTAGQVDGRIVFYVDRTSRSNGSTVDGKITIGASTLVTQLNLTAGTYASPTIQYGTYATIPNWYSFDTVPRPSGSIWFKTGAAGSGSNFAIKKYNSLTSSWTTQSSTVYLDEATALAGLDSTGGQNIGEGTVWLERDPNVLGTDIVLGYAGFRPVVRTVAGVVKTIGADTTPTITSGQTFTVKTTQPGSASLTSDTITTTGTTAAAFVTAILAADIPNVSAAVESSGAISLTHTAGGTIYLIEDAGQAAVPTQAGFTTAANNVRVEGDKHILSGFDLLTYTASITEPFADPASGSLWYYSDATEVDILVNNGVAWKGYKTLTDARNYNLANTDPAGVIVSASRPLTQTDNTALVQGDLWLDSSDLENWPKLNRWDGSSWVAIDNTDQITQNGILFADARWDTTGTTDPISDSFTSIVDLQNSSYVDIDAPDPQLYPRGMLLFNTRRSGYNVKRFVSDYFNTDTFTFNEWDAGDSYSAGDKVLYGSTLYVADTSISAAQDVPSSNSDWSLLTVGSWVTSSGNKANGSMYAGRQAQRTMVVSALQAAVNSNTQIREEQFDFNLIAAPGYPELINEMVSLNVDRSETAFVIGDTPLRLSTNVTEISNWVNNTNGDGLTTASPYLGVYYPSGLSSDIQNGNTILVPSSHMALRSFLYNDNVSYPWFAPAGTRRGLVDNVSDLGYLSSVTGEFVRTGVSQGLRDSLYQININPITIMPGTGVCIWGQKTRNPTTSALDRVNVARLVNYIRTILAKGTMSFLFEPNDKITRDQIKQVIEGAMNDLVSKRGIYDYLVVCDTSNNTPDRIARNELYVDIAISPMRSVEFIYIPIRLVNPGVISGLGK